MARVTSYTYWHSPCRAAMNLAEGAWTDDDTKKDGGSFASPINKDTVVALDVSGDFRVVKATASDDVVIGKMISEPQGDHVENGRYGTVLLFGDYILELEVHTSSDKVTCGGSVAFSASGGKFEEGVWTSDSANGTLALASTAASGSITTGSVIPVLMGYDPF